MLILQITYCNYLRFMFCLLGFEDKNEENDFSRLICSNSFLYQSNPRVILAT